MALADDLLRQARHLAHWDRTRPLQANLRRAVSSACYALFHLLIEWAVRRLLPAGAPRGMRELMARSFEHTEMRRASRWFARATLPPEMGAGLGTRRYHRTCRA